MCNQNLWKFEFLIGFGILNFVSIELTKIIVLDELCDTATVENAYVISNNTSLELYLLCRTVSVTNKPICISYACASPCVSVRAPVAVCASHGRDLPYHLRRRTVYEIACVYYACERVCLFGVSLYSHECQNDVEIIKKKKKRRRRKKNKKVINNWESLFFN